jgi:hypothetical protein
MNRFVTLAAVILLAHSAFGSVFGVLKGIVHDPQHRPISGARIAITSATSDWKAEATTNNAGEFQTQTVPVGDYRLNVSAPGFADETLTTTVTGGNAEDLHFQLAVARVEQSVNVVGESSELSTSSSTSNSIISRREIRETPGADQTNSMASITNFVPGAYMVHDQLHIRGGHQVTWAIDGVPVPNTNIAGNIGPQFDPKDID